MIAKAIAHETDATFFSISKSSLGSKWQDEPEALVKTLFEVASYRSPSIVFIDEVDSMLTSRQENESEASRGRKTEFMKQLQGVANESPRRVFIIGATNRPWELDNAILRRFNKSLHIPLPCVDSRQFLIGNLLQKNKHSLTDVEINQLSKDTEGFSGGDLKNLCVAAARGPLAQLGEEVMNIAAEDVPPISYEHFTFALNGMNPTVGQSEIDAHKNWAKNGRE